MKNLKFTFLTIITLVSLASLSTYGQLNMPMPSPNATLSGKVGLADITITYSRPSAKGRKIFGEVVPFNKIWRTGANATTKVTISDTVKINGQKLNPGEYGLYTIPGETEWTIIFGKNPKTGANFYKDEEDALRFTVKPQAYPVHIETFTIELGNFTTTSADLMILWEKTYVSFKLENEVDSKIMAQIKNSTSQEPGFYFQAANYYYETNRDLKQALEWITKSVEKDPQYWTLHLKAKIESKLNKCKEAIQTAEKSKELAKKGNNDEYVRFNEKLIAECKK